MAERRLDDVFTPALFDQAVLVENTTKLNIVQSGLVKIDPLLDEYAAASSKTGTFPFDDDLGDQDPNIVTDNPDTESTPLKTSSKESKWIKNFWHQSWSAMTLARELHHSQNDPLDLIINRAQNYWDKVYQKFTSSIIVGLTAHNIASDSSDFVLDVSTSNTPNTANYLDSAKIIEGEAKMGDSVGELTTIIMHSQIYNRLRQLDLIDFESKSAQDTLFGMYQGKTVIVNDSASLVGTSGSNVTYDTILCGAGIMGMGTALPIVPSEVTREAAKGNGGGQDILHFRAVNIIHPYGFSYKGTPTSTSPTRAEFETANSWDRTWPQQKIPLVVVRSNNAFI